jgi:hypothetical protein
MKPAIPQNIARHERLHLGPRAGSGRRVAQTTYVRLSNLDKSRPLAPPTSLHRGLALRSQRSASPRTGQGWQNSAVPGILRLRSPHDFQMQHD